MDFDLSAAKWMNGLSDQKMWFESFAIRMEQALAGVAVVERKKESLFSKRTHITSLTIPLDDWSFQLSYQKTGLLAEKSKVVGGIRLKTERIDFDQWLNELSTEINEYAKRHTKVRDAMDTYFFS